MTPYLERLFRGFKRGCHHKTGDAVVGRALRSMLTDTPLVSNLRNPEYLNILLNGHPNLESLFAQIDPVEVRAELEQAQQNPEKLPRRVKRWITQWFTAPPIQSLLEKLKYNRLLRP